MSEAYDLVVIGGGTAAGGVASRCRKAGWRVAMAEHRPLGGTCPLRGCDPKKVLVGGAQAVDAPRRLDGYGIRGDSRIDWPELIAFKRSFTDPVPEMMEKSYADKGIQVYHQRARFTGPDSVDVGGTTLTADHFVIATGSIPAPLPIGGAELLIDNDGFLALEQLPDHIVLIGGGYIAAEFAHVAARAGARVTILERAPRILEEFDPDLVGWLMEKFEAIGVDVRTTASAKAVSRSGNGYVVEVETEEGTQRVEADLVVHAAGRVPDVADLELGKAEVLTDKGHLVLNEFLQSSSNPRVYAAGDASATGLPLTPVAAYEAEIVAGNLTKGTHGRPDYSGVPSVAFTLPPIAMVGLSEEQAREQGLRFRVNTQRTDGWYSARRVREPASGHKILLEEDSDRILGAHLLGPHADEVINLFALAVRQGLAADALRTAIFAYPTGASDIGSML